MRGRVIMVRLALILTVAAAGLPSGIVPPCYSGVQDAITSPILYGQLARPSSQLWIFQPTTEVSCALGRKRLPNVDCD